MFAISHSCKPDSCFNLVQQCSGNDWTVAGESQNGKGKFVALNRWPSHREDTKLVAKGCSATTETNAADCLEAQTRVWIEQRCKTLEYLGISVGFENGKGLCWDLFNQLFGFLDQQPDQCANTGADQEVTAVTSLRDVVLSLILLWCLWCLWLSCFHASGILHDLDSSQEHVTGVYISWHADTPELSREAWLVWTTTWFERF